MQGVIGIYKMGLLTARKNGATVFFIVCIGIDAHWSQPFWAAQANWLNMYIYRIRSSGFEK